jgi:signal transduction histidine kinase
VQDSLSRIRSTVDRFDGWVNELLQATRPADINPHPVKVGPWLRGVVESHRAEAESAGVTLTLRLGKVPDTARYDAYHLEHALTAVLTNAIQATPAGGEVRVRAEWGKPDGLWRISIEDSGPGIDPELLPKIFRPYFTTKSNGSGIGLAHARQIIERHAGRIWAENPPQGAPEADSGPRGARLVVELPTDAASG